MHICQVQRRLQKCGPTCGRPEGENARCFRACLCNTMSACFFHLYHVGILSGVVQAAWRIFAGDELVAETNASDVLAPAPAPVLGVVLAGFQILMFYRHLAAPASSSSLRIDGRSVHDS